MVPKVIYHAIFGHDLKRLREFQRAKETWREFAPDFKVIRITDKHYESLAKSKMLPPYVIECYNMGMYAIVTDYIRFLTMSKNPGLWLDADVFLEGKITEACLDTDILICLDLPNPPINKHLVNYEILGVSENGLAILDEFFQGYAYAMWNIKPSPYHLLDSDNVNIILPFCLTYERLAEMKPVNNLCTTMYKDATIKLYYDDRGYSPEPKVNPIFSHAKISYAGGRNG